MKLFKSFLLLFLWMTMAMNAISQETMTLHQYLEIINRNYPLIQKANLYDEFARAYASKGKGALDPKINSSYQSKNFTENQYYTVWQTEAKIPTRLPIDFSVGYENNGGDFLNSENSVPQNGLIYGGINVSLLRGLMFDEQRFNLQMAELNGLKSQIEKDMLIREILIEAIAVYLDWSAAFVKKNIYENYQDAIQVRHQNVITLFQNGDKPAIDTIESRINLNTATKFVIHSKEELRTKQQKLNLFLWDDNKRPINLLDTVIPEVLEDVVDQIDELSFFENPEFINDPLVRKLENQIDQLNMQSRLENEQRKPQLDLKYNTILSLGKDEFDPTFSLNDYKYGINFELPVLNRKVKGELQLINARLEQNRLDQQQYHQKLVNKFQNLIYSKQLQQDIVEVVREKFSNSQLLYDAENFKFDIGESSIFLLNQRERKLLEAELEIVKGLHGLGAILNEMYYLKLGQA